MKKTLVQAAFLLSGCLAANADICRSVVVCHKDGSETSVCFQDGMELTFSDRKLTLSGINEEDGISPVSFHYEFDNLLGFRFDSYEGEKHFNGVELLGTDQIDIKLDGLTLYASGLDTGVTAFIFDTAGRVLSQQRPLSDGTLAINLSDFRNTTVIIKISTFSTTLHIK